MENLLSALSSATNLSEEDILSIEDNFIIKKLSKGDYLSREDEVCNHLVYIIDGYFRIFLRKDAEESTIHLAGPNSFLTSFSSFIDRQPSNENIQALTKTTIAIICYESLQQLYQINQRFDKIGRLIVEKHLVEKEKRVISLLTQTAEERYHQLMDCHPNLIQNVPLHYIASYLGIKPETLSRIRGRKRFFLIE